MAKQKTSRKAFATTAAAVMAATAVTPVAAFAASTTSFPDVPAGEYADAINNLVGKGILNGFEDGTFKPNDPVLREQAAKILATALKLDTTGTENYPDVSPDNWSYKYIVAVTKAGIFGGDENGKFNPFANLTRQEAAKIIVEAFDFNGSTELTFGDKGSIQSWAVPYVKTAVANGILKGDDQGNFNPNANIKRGDFALMIQRALNAVENAKTPKVESVSANNLKTLTVNFNKEVNKDSVTSKTVKVLDKDGKEIANTLAVDGKTVTVIFNTPLDQSANVKVVVDGVKSAEGKEVAKYEQELTVTDTTLPTVLSAKALNPKQVELKFSEPVNFSTGNGFSVLNNIKLDGTAVIAKATPNYANNTVVLEFSSALSAGTKKLEVSDIADFANFKIAKTEFSIDVTEDKAAPEAVKAEMINKNTVRVTFNESVATVGSFKVNGKNVSATPVANTNNTQFDLDVSENPLDLSAIVEVKVEYKGQKDLLDNEVKDWKEIKFSVADDTTLPTVSYKLEPQNKLTLTFSKSMQKVGTITVLDKDKKEVKKIDVSTLNFKADTNNRVLELTGSQLGLDDVDPADYTINLKGFKDATVRENLLPEQNIAIKAFDTKKPTIIGKYVVKQGTLTDDDAGKDDTITFYFSEPMDEDTLKNLSNYVIKNGAAFSTIDGVSVKSVAADKKSVTITYPNARNLDNEVVIVVQGVKDAAGNLAALAEVVKNTATAIDVENLTASKKNEIVVQFNTPVKSVDPSFIQVNKGAEPYAVPVKAEIDTQDPTKVKFTLNKNLETDTSVYTVTTNDYTKVENIYDAKFADKDAANAKLNKAITDELAPEITKLLVLVDGETTPREATINTDGVSATLDLSNVANAKELKEVKITSSEAADLEVLLPLLDKIKEVTDINSNAKSLGAGETTITAKSELTVGKLRTLALFDGDGNKDTLTITAQVADDHYNASDVKLVVKLK
ncbi:S-layer homology domain-containing protein [Caldifermentibacillus hisashii]|uniref:S-layer homology domain-containing protein n=1 Tax=Caldifermentibacillus hisashii TaxID=996558 RepID=UPI0031B7D792